MWASPLRVPVLRRTPRALRTQCPTALFLYLSLRLHHGLLLYRSAHKNEFFWIRTYALPPYIVYFGNKFQLFTLQVLPLRQS